jgi:hypothetical protein
MRFISNDADVVAYVLAVEAADGDRLEDSVISAYDAFITGCKSDSIWSALKASCILAGARTISGALVPLVGTAPTNSNFVSGDYNRKNGLIGNGSTKYLNANRNANADPQDSYHQSVYITSAPTTNVVRTFIGYSQSPQSFLDSSTTGVISSRLRSGTGRTAGSSTSLGFKGQSRNNATSYTIRSSATNVNLTTTSSANPSATNEVFRRGGQNTDAGLSFYSIGENLNLALLDSRVSTLMTDLATAIP